MDTQNINTTSNKKTFMQIVFCVVCTALLLYISLYTLVPFIELTGLVAIGIFCACYSILLKKGNFFICIIVPAVSVATVSFIATSRGQFDASVLASCINIVFAVVLSALLNRCAEKKANGGSTFTTLAVTAAVYVIAMFSAIIYDIYGSISIAIIKKSIIDASEFLGSIFASVPSGIVPDGDTELFNEYKSMVLEMAETVKMTFRLTVPFLIGMLAMTTAAFIYVMYKPFVKLSGMTDECLGERAWKFSLSAPSAVIFEIVFVIYIIVSFFSGNSVLLLAFMNLVSVLTVPFAYIGLRHITDSLRKKIANRFICGIIVAAGTFVLMLLLGGGVFTLSALIGASSLTRKTIRNDIER